jgi:hypothetical protein
MKALRLDPYKLDCDKIHSGTIRLQHIWIRLA